MKYTNQPVSKLYFITCVPYFAYSGIIRYILCIVILSISNFYAYKVYIYITQIYPFNFKYLYKFVPAADEYYSFLQSCGDSRVSYLYGDIIIVSLLIIVLLDQFIILVLDKIFTIYTVKERSRAVIYRRLFYACFLIAGLLAALVMPNDLAENGCDRFASVKGSFLDSTAILLSFFSLFVNYARKNGQSVV